MSRNTPGDYIPLRWEEDADTEYVHGHVSDEDFYLAVGGYYGVYGRIPDLGKPTHEWAAWRFAGSDYYGNPNRTLRTYRKAGPGRFLVTSADVTGWREVEPCAIGKCRYAKGHDGGCEPWPALV